MQHKLRIHISIRLVIESMTIFGLMLPYCLIIIDDIFCPIFDHFPKESLYGTASEYEATTTTEHD